MKKLIVSLILFAVCLLTFAQTTATPIETDYTLPAWIASISGFLLLAGQFLIANKWVGLTKYVAIVLQFLKKILVWVTYLIDFLTKLLNAVPNKGYTKEGS